MSPRQPTKTHELCAKCGNAFRPARQSFIVCDPRLFHLDIPPIETGGPRWCDLCKVWYDTRDTTSPS